MKLALEECEQDNDVDRLLDTLRLAAQAQADWRRWRRWHVKPKSAVKRSMKRSHRKANPGCALFKMCWADSDCA